MSFEEFEVNVLRVEGDILPKDLKQELSENATYIRSLNVWLFEGAWELTLLPWLNRITCWRVIYMPAYGGWSQKKLADYVEIELE